MCLLQGLRVGFKGMDLNQAQKLLEKLRQGYLAELPGRCDDIEQAVLDLRYSTLGFEELYRLVHSTKGSAGTHGLTFISVICHDLEDQLSRLDMTTGQVDDEVVNVLLQFNDLIRQVVAQAAEGREEFAECELALTELRYSLPNDRMLVMLIEPSRHTRMLCEDALKHLPLQLTLVDDGYEALGMLLRARFDMLVTAKEAKSLNAKGLIAAVRASDCVNRDIPMVMLTSRTEQNARRASDPSLVIQRSPQMGEQLAEFVSQHLQDRNQRVSHRVR